MAEKIVMPKAGMSMESGVIIKWLKNVGDSVAYGDPLLEIETDKTSMQVEAMNDGYLIATLYGEGDEVPVVTTIGYIGEKDEKPPEESGSAPPVAPDVSPEKPKEAVPVAAPAKEDTPKYTSAKIPATPLAKTLAAKHGVNLADVAGSGHGGKIKKSDVMAYIGSGTPGVHNAHAPQAAQSREDVLVPLNGMRKTIARRMSESHTEVPPVTLNSEADVTSLAALRAQVNAIEDVKLSFNDFVMKACAIALTEYPNINASFTGDGILYKGDINIGMAVALDDGLIVPVLRNADAYPLYGMSRTLKELAGRARDGSLNPDEYTGGTFSVSNLGMFGITTFTPIINMPEACILGVCAISTRTEMDDEGNMSRHSYMGLSLTFDHRCVDGASGAKFLQRVVALLEQPLELLVK